MHRKKSHKPPKSFKCSNCDETFTRKYNLTRHIKVKHNEGKFECDECGNKFPRLD